MKFTSQNPLLLLALGIILGGGAVQTAWMLRPAEKPALKSEAQAETEGPRRRSSSKSSRDNDFAGRDRVEEKARSISSKDPREAWRRSQEIRNFTERSAYISTLMEDWGKTDPLAALEMAATLPTGQLRTDAYTAACGAWASVHPEDAAKWAVSHLSGPLAGEAFGTIAGEWAANNPAAAAAWVSGLPGGAVSETATTSVITAWAGEDPRATAAWIESFSDDERKSSSLSTLASEWCDASPEDAARWVSGRLENPEAAELTEALISSWGSQDPQAASEWVMKLPAELQNSAASSLLSQWAGTDPKAAAEWVAKLPESDARGEAISTLASTWAAAEPANAVSWVLGLPDSSEQREALDDSVRAWTALDSADLGKWVDLQPANETTDHLRATAATTLMDSAPQEAMTMAGKISDPERRDESLTRLLKNWGREDPEAAKAWAAKNGFANRVTLPPADE